MIKKFFSLTLTSASIIPLVGIVVSCSNNSSPTSTDTKNVFYALDQNQIIIKYIEKTEFNLNELQTSYFDFEIDEKLANDENNQTYYEDLKKSFEKSKIELVDYFLPKLNDDKNSYLVFKINNDDTNGIINVPINQIKSNNVNDNGSLSPWDLTKNMTAEEIKSATKTKILDNKYFYSTLQDKLNFLMVKPYQNYLNTNQEGTKLNFNQYWEQYLKTDVINEMINFFDNNYLCFDNSAYKNIFISNNWNIKEENNKISVLFQISSTSFNTSQECAYDIEITLWLN